MAQKDYYEILGVDKNASDEEIKAKYKKMALKYHPDRQNGKTESEKKAAEEKFKEVVEAYEILSDKEKRQQYDQFGTIDPNMWGGGGPDIDEIMKRFMRHAGFGMFDDEDGFGRQSMKRGTDAKVRVTLTLQEAYNRGKKTIKYKRLVPCTSCNGLGSSDGSVITCPHCHGSGYVVVTQQFGFGFSRQTSVCPHCNGNGKIVKNPCKKCNGSGLEVREESITIDIPIGVADGASIMINGMGNYCERGEGSVGNLLLYFKIKEDKNFKTIPDRPYDLAYIDEVPILDCITGCERIFKHIDGKSYKYTIHSGIADGTVITLSNKGLIQQKGIYGNLNILVKHKLPRSITSEERKIIDKLKKSKNFN